MSAVNHINVEFVERDAGCVCNCTKPSAQDVKCILRRKGSSGSPSSLASPRKAASQA